MRFIALIAVSCAVLSLVACGGSGSNTESKPASATTGAAGNSAQPENRAGEPSRVAIPPGPPPKEVVVKDLRKGTGAVLGRKAEISTRFVAFDYETGELAEDHWKPPFKIHFGPGWEIRGWEKGLPGMRAGGRRELIVPSGLAYGKGARIYVIELLSVG